MVPVELQLLPPSLQRLGERYYFHAFDVVSIKVASGVEYRSIRRGYRDVVPHLVISLEPLSCGVGEPQADCVSSRLQGGCVHAVLVGQATPGAKISVLVN